MNDTGKSSSRNLRRAIYYTLHRTDPQKTHYKNSCFASTSKSENCVFFRKIGLYSPLTPIGRCRELHIYIYVFMGVALIYCPPSGRVKKSMPWAFCFGRWTLSYPLLGPRATVQTIVSSMLQRRPHALGTGQAPRDPSFVT